MKVAQYKELERLIRATLIPAEKALEVAQRFIQGNGWEDTQRYRDCVFARQKLIEIMSLLQEEDEKTQGKLFNNEN